MTGQVSRLFLGVQLQCAQCHNHPFTDWKQDEYWGMAAFFMKVKQDGTPKMLAKDGGTITVNENCRRPRRQGRQGRMPRRRTEVPEGAKVRAGQVPHRRAAQDGPEWPGPARTGQLDDLARQSVSSPGRWSTGSGTTSSAAASSIPIDDMHDDNPATHPELLTALAEQFKRHDFDLKYLSRPSCISETYQRTEQAVPGQRGRHRTLQPHVHRDFVAGTAGRFACRESLPAPDKARVLRPRRVGGRQDKKGKVARRPRDNSSASSASRTVPILWNIRTAFRKRCG